LTSRADAAEEQCRTDHDGHEHIRAAETRDDAGELCHAGLRSRERVELSRDERVEPAQSSRHHSGSRDDSGRRQQHERTQHD